MRQGILYHFLESDTEQSLKAMGKEELLRHLKQMLLIRNFELKAEAAYLQGKIGGFFHSYMGQEAVQTAAVAAINKGERWWSTSYRCHALALLLGATPNELMAELYGRGAGNAKGRGGSMHFYTDRLLGGFGIVGGQIPIGTGAAFTLKYRKMGGVSVCFMGDGAVAQGVFHESLNIAALWELPCIYVIENNEWGMGTAVHRAISVAPIAELMASSYGIKGYTLDGMDFIHCYNGFAKIFEEVLTTSRPVLVEMVTERFRGHSVSDPALYRSKEELSECMKRDPLKLFRQQLIDHQLLTESEYTNLEKEQKELVAAAVELAEQSSWPDPSELEKDVFA